MKSINKSSLPCAKSVPCRELIALRNTLEQLESWTEPLEVLARFFHQSTMQVNSKKTLKDYHASAKLFQTFQQDYQMLLTKAQTQVHSFNEATLTSKVLINDSNRKKSNKLL